MFTYFYRSKRYAVWIAWSLLPVCFLGLFFSSLLGPGLSQTRWLLSTGFSSGAVGFWQGFCVVPLFLFIVGYHPWRKICPLACFARLANRVPLNRRRRLKGTWLEHYGPDLQFALLGCGLVLRTLYIGKDTYGLVAVVTALFALAFAVNLVWGGKTWCQYFCPMAPVETVFAEVMLVPRKRLPAAKNPANSMCTPCVGCVRHCADIDVRKATAKNLSTSAWRRFHYGYPGLVAGFFLGTDLLPLPNWLAAPLSELVLIAASYLLFTGWEWLWQRWLLDKSATRTVRRAVCRIADYTAIVLFFSGSVGPFAQVAPWLSVGLWLGVTLLATYRLALGLQVEGFGLARRQPWNPPIFVPLILRRDQG